MSGATTLEDAPGGTIVLVGHPHNNHTARKVSDSGPWRSLVTGRDLDLDHGAVTVLFTPWSPYQ